MTAKLLVREVGKREFSQHNGQFEDGTPDPDEPMRVMNAAQSAHKKGEQLCREGNVEAFQVWELVTTKQRVWKLEEVAA